MSPESDGAGSGRGTEAEGQEEVVAFLSTGAAYGEVEPPLRIDTHAAIVFLAGPFAYKMKRAVTFPFLDFSTLERRKAACRAELALNRPNAPDIYLDVVPVVRERGRLRIAGEGPAVEWLVKMRRFDPQDTLDHAAADGRLTAAVIARLMDKVAEAWRTAPAVDGAAATDRLLAFHRGNVDQLLEQTDIFPAERVAALDRRVREAFEAVRPLLLRRGAAGHARRCHGDLHLRNIVLMAGEPVLFDALEFDDAMASVDVFYDLAFLLMDLWRLDLRQEANQALNRLLWRTDDMLDIEGCRALPMMMSIRAAIRAKITAANLSNLQGAARNQAAAEARSYFAAAERFMEPVAPLLVAIGGLSGAGKTTVAARLCSELGAAPGAIHLRSDIERKRLWGAADAGRLPPQAYEPEVTAAVYGRLRDKAARALGAGQTVVLDAVHARPEERAAAELVAREAGTPFAGVWLDAAGDTLVERVEQRRGDASDATAAVVRQQLGYELGRLSWERLDAGRPVAATVSEIIGRLRRR